MNVRSCESLRGTSIEVCKLGIFFTAYESCWSKKDQNWFYVRWRVQLSVSLSFLVLFFRMAGSLTLKLIGRSLGTIF